MKPGARLAGATAAALLATAATVAADDAIRYAAAIHGGIVAAEPGGYVGQPFGAPHGGALPLLRVDFETPHAHIGAGWDAALAFDAALKPLFVMCRCDAGLAADYRSGWTVGQSIRFAKTVRSTETSVVGRAGAAWIELDRIAANGIGRWALVFDTRAELHWFGRSSRRPPASRTSTPLVDAYAGVRHDQRLHREGDLSPFDDPTGRIVFGFGVMPFRPAIRVAAGGRFDYEGALRGATRLPSGFRAAAVATVRITPPTP